MTPADSLSQITIFQLMVIRVLCNQKCVFKWKELSKGKALFILHVMIGMLSSHLVQSEIIIYGLVRKCVRLSPFS